jgi:hypothetical protein
LGTGDIQHGVRQVSRRLAGVQRPFLPEYCDERQRVGSAFEHAIGDDHETVAGLQLQLGSTIFAPGVQAERQIGR